MEPNDEPKDMIDVELHYLATENARLRAALEIAWGIIANAGGGDWKKETPEWQEAAARWRDENLEGISETMKARAALEGR